MKQYSLVSPKGEYRLAYNQDGHLIKYEVLEADDAAIIYLSRNIPATEEELKQMASRWKCELIEMPMDLSFDNFWNTYNYKIGNKARAEKLWSKMSDADKTKALMAIPKYERYLKTKNNMEKAYPETYLSQKRYENTFK